MELVECYSYRIIILLGGNWVIKMKQIIQSLTDNWSIEEHQGDVGAIQERVDSESNYTFCKGYENIKSNEVEGRAGEPLPE
mgnify:CR=1 FL=1